jgi:hypothetical protein
MSPVELLVTRLSEVQGLLSDLPNDAFAERAALLAERDELQARAARHAAGADPDRPAADIQHEIDGLSLAWREEDAGSATAVRILGRIERLTGILVERESGSPKH